MPNGTGIVCGKGIGLATSPAATTKLPFVYFCFRMNSFERRVKTLLLVILATFE